MWYDHVTCTAAVTCTFNSFHSYVSLDINKPLNQFLQTANTWKVKNTS